MLGNGGFYRIYLAPNTNIVLSMEQVEWGSHLADEAEAEDSESAYELGHVQNESSSE